MPKIRFILVRCAHCGAEYRVRLERVEEGKPFECLACGDPVPVEGYVDILKLLHQYSILVLDVEKRFTLDGDTAVPKPGVSYAPTQA